MRIKDPCQRTVRKTEIQVQFCLRDYLVHMNTYLLINCFVNTQEKPQKIELRPMLTQGVRTIFIDKLLSFHVYKKVYTILESNCSTVYH